MSILQPPESYPWWFAAFLLILSPVLLAAMLAPSFIPVDYTVPPESALKYAEGRLLLSKPGVKSPYTLTADSGEEIKFGCWPSATYADCLDEGAFNLSELARHHVRIGYFRKYNWSNSGLSNVIVTLAAEGKPLLTYDQGRENIQRWAVRDQQALHSWPVLVAAMAFPFFLFGLAMWIILAKRKIEQTRFRELRAPSVTGARSS